MYLNFKSKKGITLIALIVTIIVLLILSGVAIISLTGETGLLEKASKAGDKTSEGKAKEKLQLEISDLINEKAVELKDATIDDLIERLSKDTSYQTKKREPNKLIVGVDGHAFMLDENLKIVDIVDISLVVDAKMEYLVKSINGNTMNIQVIAKSDNGLDMIVTPDEQEIKPTGDETTKIEADYSVTVGQEYIFKLKLHNIGKTREFKLTPSSDSMPKIANNNDPVYPVLTANGFKILKEIKIDYGTNTNKYYSVDNGETWLEYKDKVVIDKNCTLMAKSFSNEDIVTKIDTANIELKLAGNALGRNAYDGKNYPICNAYSIRFNVDPSAWGKNVRFYSHGNHSNRYSSLEIYGHNSSGTRLFTQWLAECGFDDKDSVVTMKMPENTAYMITNYKAWSGIGEISIVN